MKLQDKGSHWSLTFNGPFQLIMFIGSCLVVFGFTIGWIMSIVWELIFG